MITDRGFMSGCYGIRIASQMIRDQTEASEDGGDMGIDQGNPAPMLQADQGDQNDQYDQTNTSVYINILM